MDTEENPGASLSSRRACDQCRLRKIRCDKDSPCSNCKSAQRSCSSTGLGQKPKEPRQRVLISSQYERKIDDMQERLAGIETLLRNLAPVSGRSSGPSVDPISTDKPTPSLSSASRDGSSTVYDPDDTEDFEGSTSLTAHAAFASELVSQAVHTNMNSTPFGTPNPRIEAALSSLRQMVNLQTSRALSGDESRWPAHNSMPVSRIRLRNLPMPPMDLVVEKLRVLKNTPGPLMLLVVTCFTDIDRFTDNCRRLYFCTDDSDISDGLFVTVNAGLAYLFFEDSISAPAGSAEKAKLDSCFQICQNNLQIVLTNLPLMMPATLENIEALLLGASFAVDLSRPSLAWLLTSRAAHMCRALGMHQENNARNDTPAVRADKALYFWSTYMLDKGLSLRLGRASILQDYDISVANVLETTHGAQPSQVILSLWIKHAELQGKIYQRLYSPGALRQSETARTQQVHVIVPDLKLLIRETMALLEDMKGQDQVKESKMFQLILKSDEVSYHSSMALAYRALPPTTGGRSRTFADECLDSAQSAMRTHHEAMDMMDDTSLKIVYLHWTILYAPFIPFIVIFCHVIETSSATDLHCLQLFIQSLESGCDVSPAVAKLHQLSTVLYNVALLYVEAKTQQTLDQDMVPVGNEFDMYLSQLGFMPMDEGPSDVGDEEPKNVLQTTQLGDWFSGGNHILGLVEEDLSTFNTFAW